MTGNQQNFLDWMTKAILDLCDTHPASGSTEDGARTWFLASSGLPPAAAAETWMDAQLAKDIFLPVSPVRAFPPPPPTTNGALYVADVQAKIEALLLLSSHPAGSNEDEAAKFFAASPRSTGTSTTSVPLPVRDWVRGAVASGGTSMKLAIEMPLGEGEGAVILEGALAAVEAKGLKRDLLGLVLALDAAERVKGETGRKLVRQTLQAMLEAVQAAIPGIPGKIPGKPKRPPVRVMAGVGRTAKLR